MYLDHFTNGFLLGSLQKQFCFAICLTPGGDLFKKGKAILVKEQLGILSGNPAPRALLSASCYGTVWCGGILLCAGQQHPGVLLSRCTLGAGMAMEGSQGAENWKGGDKQL